MTVDGVFVEVTRKKIKHFHLKIHRPDGRVRVSAPRDMTEKMIRSMIVSRFDWIRAKLEQAKMLKPGPQPEYVSGERHWFQGQPYELKVLERNGPWRVYTDGGRVLAMQIKPGSDASKRRAVLEDWYRSHLRRAVPGLVRRWQSALGVEVAEWRIKRMKTRWGTCNPVARRIWLNLALAQQSPACLEYVVVHEMVHLLERGHNARFYGYLDRFLPGWRTHRDSLHRVALN